MIIEATLTLNNRERVAIDTTLQACRAFIEGERYCLIESCTIGGDLASLDEEAKAPLREMDDLIERLDICLGDAT